MKKAVFQIKIENESKARSLRDSVLEQVMDFLNHDMADERKLGYTLRLLKGKKPSRILDMMKEAQKDGKSPQALFIWKCKQK